jgi:hypothetical protein
MTPVADYSQGWSSCPHCRTNLFMPPVYSAPADGEDGTAVLLPLRGHEFPPPEET